MINGQSIYNAGSVSADLSLIGRFTVAASQSIELQYWAQFGVSTNGLGVQSSSGEPEVYGIIELWKE